MGKSFLSSEKATLKASTRIRSLVACAVRYFCVALRRRRRSSRESDVFSWLQFRLDLAHAPLARSTCSTPSESLAESTSMLLNVSFVMLARESACISMEESAVSIREMRLNESSSETKSSSEESNTESENI